MAPLHQDSQAKARFHKWRHYRRRLTKRPHKVVFWPQSQHGQVKVDDLQVEGRGADEVVVDGVLHGEELAQRQIHKQRDGTGGQFGDDGVLGGGERNNTPNK